jgi:hypothetical protein
MENKKSRQKISILNKSEKKQKAMKREMVEEVSVKGQGKQGDLHHLHIGKTKNPMPKILLSLDRGQTPKHWATIVKWLSDGMNDLKAMLSAQMKQPVSVPSKGRKGDKDANDSNVHESLNPRPVSRYAGLRPQTLL